MPINPVAMPRTSAEERQNALLSQFLKGTQDQNNIAAQGNVASSEAQQKAQLGQQGEEAAVQRAQGMQAANPGSMVKTGSAEVNPMPQVKQGQLEMQQAMKNQTMQTQALNKAYGAYNKGASGLSGKLDVLDEMTGALKNPNQMTLGTLRSTVLRSVGLNRFNQPEAAALVPPSAQGAFSRMSSWVGGDASSVTPQQLKDVADFAGGVANAIKNNHETLKQQVAGQYGNIPGATPEKLESLQNQMGAPVDQRIASIQKGLTDISQAQPRTAASSPQGAMGAAQSGLSGLKALLFGNSQQGAAPAPQSAQAPAPGGTPPMSFEEFKKRKAEGSL